MKVQGLDSREALLSFVDELKQFLKYHVDTLNISSLSFNSFLLKHPRKYITSIICNIMLSIVSIALLLKRSYTPVDTRFMNYWSFEAFELLFVACIEWPIIIFLLIIRYIRWKDGKQGMAKRLNSWINRIEKELLTNHSYNNSPLFCYPELSVPFHRALELIRCIRCQNNTNSIVWVPIDLLVTNDIIILADDEVVIDVEYQILKDISTDILRYCRVTQTPMIKRLKEMSIRGDFDPYQKYHRGYDIYTLDKSLENSAPRNPSSNTILLPPKKHISPLYAHLDTFIKNRCISFKYWIVFILVIGLFLTRVCISSSLTSFLFFSIFLISLVYTLPLWGSLIDCFVDITEAYEDARLTHLWETLQISQKPFLERGQSEHDIFNNSKIDEQKTAFPSQSIDEHLFENVKVDIFTSDTERIDDHTDAQLPVEDDHKLSSCSECSHKNINNDSDCEYEEDESLYQDLNDININDQVYSTSSSSDSSEYEEDEFDSEAVPPTQDVSLSRICILKGWLKRLFNPNGSVIRLFSSFSNVSVICSNQEKGILFKPFPIPEVVVFFRQKSSSSELVSLDLVPDDIIEGGNEFEDPSWKQYSSSLQPLSYCLAIRHPYSFPYHKCNDMTNRDLFTTMSTIAHSERRRRRLLGPHLAIHWISSSHENNTTLDANYISSMCADHHLFTSGHQTCFCGFALMMGGNGIFRRLWRYPLNMNANHTKDDLLSMENSKSTGQILGWTSSEDQQTSYFKKRWVHYYITIEHGDDDIQISIVGQGDYEQILFQCSDVWNGYFVEGLSDEHRRKMTDYGMTEERNYLQVLAFSLRVVSVKELNLNDSSLARLKKYPGYYYMKWKDSNMDSTQSAFYSVGHNDDKDRKDPYPIHDPLMINLLSHLISKHTFIGLLGLGSLRNENICECIQDFGQAGIRFVYFSSRDERFVKDIGYRLDLETDWNSCILLSGIPQNGNISTTDYPLYKSTKAPKGHLPMGIENIKTHLLYVDDIPLRISLFAECKIHHIQQMFDIYKEAGEIVCYWGSQLCGRDLPLYMHSHIGIAGDPLPESFKTSYSGNSWHILNLVSSLHESVCNLMTMKHGKSPYIITQMIRDARSFQHNMNSSLLFYVSSTLCLSLVSVLILIFFGWPMPVSILGFSWLYIIILPIQSISLMCSQDDPGVMKWMPKKQNRLIRESHNYSFASLQNTEYKDEPKLLNISNSNNLFPKISIILKKFIIYFSPKYNFIITILRKWWLLCMSSILLYYMSLLSITRIIDENVSNTLFTFPEFYIIKPTSTIFINYENNNVAIEHIWIFKYIQNIFSLTFVILCISQSSASIHAIMPLREFPPSRNWYWIFSSILILVLQVLYTIISLNGCPIPLNYLLSSLSLEFWLSLFLSILLVVLYQEYFTKERDHNKFIQSERRAKLEFKTKLGMHSPI